MGIRRAQSLFSFFFFKVPSNLIKKGNYTCTVLAAQWKSEVEVFRN